MIRTLFIPELTVSECVRMTREDQCPFAVVGNRSRIPLFIGVPCGVDVEKEPLRAVEEAIKQLEALKAELRAVTG